MATSKPQKIPPKPHLPKGSTGIRLGLKNGRWRFRAVVKIQGRQVTGPYREDFGSAHADWLGLVGRRNAPPRVVRTLAQGLAAALAAQEQRGRAGKNSQQSTQLVAAALLRAWDGDLPLEGIDAGELDWYVSHATKGGRALATVVEKDLPMLRQAMRAGGATWPAGFTAPRKPRRHMAVLTSDELVQILDRVRREVFHDRLGRRFGVPARERHADLIEFLWLTGLRVGEAARLSVADIDLPRCSLTVRNHKDAGAVLGVSQDVVVLGEQSRDLLCRLVAAAAPRRAEQRKKNVPPARLLLWPGGMDQIARTLHTLKRRLGEPRLCGRTLRHSFVSATLKLTGDLAATRDLARHRSVQTTARYVHALTQQQSSVRSALAESVKSGRTPPDDRPAHPGASPDRPGSADGS